MMKSFLEKGEFGNPREAMMEGLGKRYDHLSVVD